jgi:hypothetical protein
MAIVPVLLVVSQLILLFDLHCAYRVLNFQYTNMSGSIPSTIGDMSSLYQLLGDHCRLEGTLPVALSRLNWLAVLSLSNNRLTGSIPPGIGALQGLVHLALHGNRLSSTLPRYSLYTLNHTESSVAFH